MTTQKFKILKWSGVKNSDTNKVHSGYLYIEFLEDCTFLNTNPAIIGAKPQDYKKGQTIGFGIRASSRIEAIGLFNKHYILQNTSKTLFSRILNNPTALNNFKNGDGISACIYPEAFEGKDEVVRWFYSRNNGRQVFYACSQDISDVIDMGGWADISYEFTDWVENTLMPYCKENTDWDKCNRYGIPYDVKVPNEDERGCEGTSCCCEPFGQGDFTYGIAEETEFTL